MPSPLKGFWEMSRPWKVQDDGIVRCFPKEHARLCRNRYNPLVQAMPPPEMPRKLAVADKRHLLDTLQQELEHILLKLEKPTSPFNLGDIARTTTTVNMHIGEDLSSTLQGTLEANVEVRIEEIGTDSRGTRVLISSPDAGRVGWVSVHDQGGTNLLELVRRAEAVGSVGDKKEELIKIVRSSEDLLSIEVVYSGAARATLLLETYVSMIVMMWLSYMAG